jgi:hypothetical protein
MAWAAARVLGTGIQKSGSEEVGLVASKAPGEHEEQSRETWANLVGVRRGRVVAGATSTAARVPAESLGEGGGGGNKSN